MRLAILRETKKTCALSPENMTSVWRNEWEGTDGEEDQVARKPKTQKQWTHKKLKIDTGVLCSLTDRVTLGDYLFSCPSPIASHINVIYAWARIAYHSKFDEKQNARSLISHCSVFNVTQIFIFGERGKNIISGMQVQITAKRSSLDTDRSERVAERHKTWAICR